MPDVDIQTKYYNPYSGLEEWRYAYCKKTYLTSRSTSGPKRHLIKYHHIPNESTRGVKVQNI
jgi:hypothetical protein